MVSTVTDTGVSSTAGTVCPPMGVTSPFATRSRLSSRAAATAIAAPAEASGPKGL